MLQFIEGDVDNARDNDSIIVDVKQNNVKFYSSHLYYLSWD